MSKQKIEETAFPSQMEGLVAGKSYQTENIGRSGATVLTYETMVLKVEPESDQLEELVAVMKWLSGRLPVPEILAYEKQDGMGYLLMSRIPGRMSCDTYYLEHPQELVRLLAEGLKMLWSVDVSDCPRERSLEKELAEARERVERNLVKIEWAEPDTFGEGGFESPAALLQWLEENKPVYEPVFSHGDYCLPNVFLKDGRVSGFIDLGDAGIGDKWRDISLCYRSLKHNFDGTFGKRVYGGLRPEQLLEELGIEPDWEKLRYYILLDELF